MKKRTTISILSVFLLFTRVCATPLEDPQSETNTIWRLYVSFNLASEDLSKLFKERFFSPQSFSFFVLRNGTEIIADTGSYNPHISKQFGFHPITSFITVSDQQALFTNACNLVKSSQCVTSSIDVPAIEKTSLPIFSVHITIDGDDGYLRCKPSDHKTGSSCQVCHLIALLRRNLPSSFDTLFDYLHIEKLPPLADGKSNQFGSCSVHNESLKVGSVPVAYGLIMASAIYLKAQSRLFPNASTTISGGCVIHPGRQTESMTLYCESCRRTEAKWRKENTLQQDSVPNTSARR